MNIKDQVSKITSNPIGAIAGGGAAFYGAKKFGKVTNKWVLAGITLVGVVAGAFVQAKIKAHKSHPTAETVKK